MDTNTLITQLSPELNKEEPYPTLPQLPSWVGGQSSQQENNIQTTQ